jgi:metal-responsive CopG/Arc/MetJ family transcriptional regulator
MKQSETHQTVAIWMEKGLLERVDKLAEKAEVTRSKLIGNMVEMTTKSLERADAFGILSIAILLRDFEVSMKAWVNQMRDEGSDLKEIYESGGEMEALS